LISGVAIGCVIVCLLAVALFFLFRQGQTDASEIGHEMGYETDGKVEARDNLDFNEKEDMSFADTLIMFEDDSWMHGHVFSRPHAAIDFSAEKVFM
jgi:hypothetical protein